VRIQGRLLLALTAAVLVSSILGALTSVYLLRSSAVERSRERVRSESELLAAWVRGSPQDLDPQSLAVDAGRALGARVTLIARDGTVVGDSERQSKDLAAIGNHLARPEIQQAGAAGTGESVRTSDTTGEDYLYFARRIDAGPVAFVRIALPHDRLWAGTSRSIGLLASAFPVLLAAIAAVAYLVVRRLSRPIEELIGQAERAAGGNPRPRLPDGGEDEVTRLGASIDRMQKALLGKIHELDDEKDLLASVVGGMKEGLLLVGADRRIRLANDAFRQIFGPPFDPAGHLLAEVIRNPTVTRELHSALQEGREVRESVLHASDSGRSFELHVTPLGGRTADRSGGALILFFDITRLEALEGVRREFVANVSHELRTPLTSIKAFVETLFEDELRDRENSLRFLEIVRKHADRMGELIDDLTDLSLIETGAVSLELQEVDAHEVVEEVALQLSHRHGSSGVEIRVDVPSPFVLRSDRRRLEQILVNLMDNAVKFNRPGGHVRVSATIVAGRPTIAVEDNGVGIPADSLEKVFHRFYRVDRARSREVGGTGLGLAIVKHLMRLHGGQVGLESEVGRGSRFVLEFPPPLEGTAAAVAGEGAA
jgi:two-component system phosphate regulon sensor histidine kinase PhoR